MKRSSSILLLLVVLATPQLSLSATFEEDQANGTMVVNGTEGDDVFKVTKIGLYISRTCPFSPPRCGCGPYGYYYEFEMNGETYSFQEPSERPYDISVFAFGGRDRAIVSGDNEIFLDIEQRQIFCPSGEAGPCFNRTEIRTPDAFRQDFFLDTQGSVIFTNAGTRMLRTAFCAFIERDVFESKITLDGFEEFYVYGESSDAASLFDTVGDDVFVTAGTFSYMEGADGTFHLVSGVPLVYGHTINGGVDAAWHYDTENTGEEFVASGSEYSYMSGNGFFNVAVAFPLTYAFSAGDDSALFYDSPGVDTFVGDTNQSYMSGPGFFNLATGFSSVSAQSFVGGADSCYLRDPTLNRAAGFVFRY